MSRRRTRRTLELSGTLASVVLITVLVVVLITVFVVLARPGRSTSQVTTETHLTAGQRAGLSHLPRWERGFWVRDLLARRVTALPALVPRGGVALDEPGTTAVWLSLQPATPTASDLSASQADVMEENQVGGNISSTVFGLGTMASDLVPTGAQVPPNDVLNRPVWVVTIQDPEPYSNPTCGPAGSQCGPAEYTTYVTVEDAVTGQMLAGFSD